MQTSRVKLWVAKKLLIFPSASLAASLCSRSYKMDRSNPPSTRIEAPFVAEANGLE